ncbi:MAG: YihY/virulence factor BrkB family protein [Bacilli bacterium]|nr:YihY/virulence factor BrkB family protein [Bacilli bacterium]
MKKFGNWIKRLFVIISRPELRILPGQLAFFLFLSMVPIITLTVYFAGIFAVSTESIVTFVKNTIPGEVSDLLLPYLLGKGFNFTVGISMITGFIVASNGAHSIIITSNILYKVEDSPYLTRRIKAFIMTIILVFLFIFMLVILAFGNNILEYIFSLGLFAKIKQTVFVVYFILKWTLALFIVFLLVKVLYTMAPDRRIQSKYVNKGAIFTTISFVLVSTIYSYYVSNFTNYDVLYGGLSSIVILMIFVYFLSYIFTVGIAINADEYQMVNKGVHK